MFELFVAMKHITTRRRQTLLAVSAVALAVAITVVEISAANGLEETILGLVFEIAPHVVVSQRPGEDYIYLYKTLMDGIWAIPEVAAVSPNLFTEATFSHEENVENVRLAGVIPDELNKISKIGDYYMAAGDLYAIQNGRRVVLSQEAADDLDVELGEEVAGLRDSQPLNLVVVGIFDTGVEWDEFAFVSMETAREFEGEGDVINEIHVQLDDIYQADSVAAEIAPLGYRTRSWQRMFPELLRTIEFEKIQTNLIMLLIMVIASFGVANVMNMLVLEKTKEIGMMMATGATSSNIRRIFLLESGILGLIGGIVGSLLGYLISFYLNSMEIALPPIESVERPPITLIFPISLWEILAVALVALFLSTAMGVYPAHKASKLDPVVALRG